MSAGEPHITAATIARDAGAVLAYLGDAANLDQWSFGTWSTEIGSDGLVRGTSLFDGGETFVRIETDAKHGIIHYFLGAEPERLLPRILVRVIPGHALELDPGHCVASMMAWRTAGMDDERWRRLVACHECEILLVKSLLEKRQP